MPITTYTTLDEVPEPQRGSAVEAKDGTFYVFADEDVSGLKSALAKVKAERDEAKAVAQKAAAAAREADLKEKGLLEAKQKWDAELLKPLADKAAALEAQLRAAQMEAPLKAKLGTLLVDEKAVEAVWRLEADKFDLADGKPILKDNPTADVGQYLEGLKGTYAWAFKGTQAAGGGAAGSTGAPAKVIPMTDTKAFLANLSDIAAGKVAVAS